MLLRTLILSVLGLSASLAAAVVNPPPDLSGKWSFQGEVVSSHKIETAVVRVANPLGQKRLQELRDLKFSCLPVSSSTYRCTKPSSEAWEVPAEHQKEVALRMERKSFEFVKTEGEPELISDAPSVKQWSLPLLAYSEEGKTDSVILWQTENLGKLEFEIGGEKLWPSFTDPSALNVMVKIEEARKDVFTKFYYHAVFSRE